MEQKRTTPFNAFYLFLRTSRLRVTPEFLLGTQPIFDVVAILPAT